MTSMTFLLAASLAFGDDLFVVHHPEKGPHFATRTPIVDGASTQSLGPLAGSFQKCFSQMGKQQLRAMFAVDRDGDGVDELAFVREWKSSGKHTLSIAAPPTKASEKKPAIAVSTKRAYLTEFLADGELVAAGRFDRDGDGIDEWSAVAADADGAIRISVRDLPNVKNESIAPPLVELLTSETELAGRVVGAFGLPVDPEPGDELVLCVAQGDVVRAVAYDVPASQGGGLVAIVDLGVLGADAEFLASAPARVGASLDPGFLTLLSSEESSPRIESRALLATGTLSTPVLSVTAPFAAFGVFAIAGLRREEVVVPPPPPTSQACELRVFAAGAQVATLTATVSWPDGVAGTKLDGQFDTSVVFATGAMINTECSQVNFTPSQFLLVLPEVSDVPGTSGILALNVPVGTASFCGLSTQPYFCEIGSDIGPSIGTLTLNTSVGPPLSVQRVVVVPSP